MSELAASGVVDGEIADILPLEGRKIHPISRRAVWTGTTIRHEGMSEEEELLSNHWNSEVISRKVSPPVGNTFSASVRRPGRVLVLQIGPPLIFRKTQSAADSCVKLH